MFDPKRLSRSPAAFDGKKLEWVNNQYVKAADNDELSDSAIKQLIKAGKLPEDPDFKTIAWARHLVDLYKRQMSYTAQLADMAEIFFTEPQKLDEDCMNELSDESAAVVLNEFAKRIKELPLFDAVEIQKTIRGIQKRIPESKAASFTCRFALQRLVKCTVRNLLLQSNCWAKARA